MDFKSLLKIIRLETNLKIRGVNYKNVHAWTHIGRYTIIKTDPSSVIEFNDHIAIHNFVSLLAEDNGKITFGKRVYIGDYSTLRASRSVIEIGSNTMIAQHVNIVSTNHFFKDKNKLINEQDIDLKKIGVKIGDDCWLGAGCTILPGVTIGNGAVIGANALVSKNVPEYALAIGNPARVSGYRK